MQSVRIEGERQARGTACVYLPTQIQPKHIQSTTILADERHVRGTLLSPAKSRAGKIDKSCFAKDLHNRADNFDVKTLLSTTIVVLLAFRIGHGQYAELITFDEDVSSDMFRIHLEGY
jgi:hypothetical protein